MAEVWINQNKNPEYFLLLESGTPVGFILQENGFQILLDQSGSGTSLWTNETKD